MALRILTSRVLQSAGNGTNSSCSSIRVCVNASMSSSTPSVPPSSEKSPSVKKPVTRRKRESLRSYLATIFGGNLDPADPDDPPIPMSEIRPAHVTEQATGEAKLFLIAFENGIIDPYCNLPVERRGRGTKDNPIPIESFADYRVVACLCEPAQNFHRYSIVYRGDKKRCNCGHWMELVDAPKFWQKIPKEELCEIEFYRKLEEKGQLDEYLKTGKIDGHDPLAEHH